MDNESNLPTSQTDLDTITNLLQDPVIIRIVTVLDVVNLSILELLEYGLSRINISYALGSGVIEIDKTTLPAIPATSAPEDSFPPLDIYYFQLLSSKVHLTKLGLFLLDSLKESQAGQGTLQKTRHMPSSDTFSPPDFSYKKGSYSKVHTTSVNIKSADFVRK